MSDRRIPLRCPSTSWGHAVGATGTLEEQCKGKYCRTAEGRAVIHKFDLETGSFITLSIETVAPRPKEHHHGSRQSAV